MFSFHKQDILDYKKKQFIIVIIFYFSQDGSKILLQLKDTENCVCVREKQLKVSVCITNISIEKKSFKNNINDTANNKDNNENNSYKDHSSNISYGDSCNSDSMNNENLQVLLALCPSSSTCPVFLDSSLHHCMHASLGLFVLLCNFVSNPCFIRFNVIVVKYSSLILSFYLNI